MATRSARLVAVLAGMMAWAAAARACPVCESEAGRRVRDGIFGVHFGTDLLATMLPFPVLLAVVAAIHAGAPRPRRRSRASDAPARSRRDGDG